MGIEGLLLVILGVLSAASAIGAVIAKSLVYSAFSLGMLGIFMGAIFVVSGYLYLGIFMVAVYSGAVVIFIILIAMMFKVTPRMSRRFSITALVTSLVVAFSLSLISTRSITFFTEGLRYLSLEELSDFVVRRPAYIYLVSFTLAATMIEVMALVAKVVRR